MSHHLLMLCITNFSVVRQIYILPMMCRSSTLVGLEFSRLGRIRKKTGQSAT